MTIERAVEIYNAKKRMIKDVDDVIKRIKDRNAYFETFPNQWVLTSKDMEDIGIMLKNYKERLENDLKADFKY